MYQTRYADAYTEVYEILSCLNEEEYMKIPGELIEVFEENRNLNYEYEVNEEQDLTKQPMLQETKAILLNIFRDYLATPEQSQRIREWLQPDRTFNEDILENKNKTISNLEKADTRFPIEIKKQSIFQKIINRLRKILGR